jgi:hypothetical protein
MIKQLVAVGCIAFVFLVSGCASQHEQRAHFPSQSVAVEDGSKGRIYVIRQPWLWNVASRTVPIAVFDGEERVGTIATGHGFLCWERAGGVAEISCQNSKESISVPVEKGKAYYVLQHVKPDGFGPGAGLKPRLELVDEATGKEKLSKASPPAKLGP